MRVLIITNLFPNAVQPQRGLFNKQQAVGLARACPVTVVAPVVWVPKIAKIFKHPWASLAHVPAHETIEGIEVYHPRYLAIPVLSRPFNGLLYFLGIRGIVRRLETTFRFDRILATWAYPDVVASTWIAQQHRVPIIARLHGSDVHVYANGPWRRRAVRAALQRCHAVIAVSEAMQAELVRWGIPARKIAVIPNGVDEERFTMQDRAACRRALELPMDGQVVLFVGNLVPVKGTAFLVDAFHRYVKASREPVTLAIVGDGPDAPSLRRQVAALGLQQMVRFPGARSHEEIAQWLNAADVLCLSSVSEGCPNVVLEALACGTPVVGTRIGGVPERIRDGDNGYLAPPQDAAGLARALARALSTTWDRVRIQASVAGDSWSANVRRVADLLEQAGSHAGALTALHVLRYSMPNMSGYTIRSQALIEGQQALGVCPVVVTSTRHEAAADLETINGIRYYRCHVFSHPVVRWLQTDVPLVRTLLTMAQLFARIVEVARTEGAQLIHAHSPVMCGFPAWLAARRLRVPFVYEVRALWEDAAVDQEKTTEGSLAYRLSRWLETVVLRRADRIFVICDGLKRELIARGLPAPRIVLSLNGVNPDAFAPLTGKDPRVMQRYGLQGRNVIGFIGSFFQFEGLECLLRAVPALIRRDPSIRVMIVGGGEREQDLRRLAETAGLNGTVIFTGRVPHDEINAYYSVMDALVYPRLSRRITELVTPLKPLEAMALGRPVVASDVGGLKELVTDGETGVLFRAGDPDALAEACLRLVHDPVLAARLVEQARAFVQQERTWRTVCKGNVKLYGELLGVTE